MKPYIELIQMRPVAEFMMERVRIHEHDEDAERFTFTVKGDVPYLPICDELVEKMREFGEFAKNQQTLYPDRKERYEAFTAKRREVQEFAYEVEQALNRAYESR